jgi:hypothetical protein
VELLSPVLPSWRPAVLGWSVDARGPASDAGLLARRPTISCRRWEAWLTDRVRTRRKGYRGPDRVGVLTKRRNRRLFNYLVAEGKRMQRNSNYKTERPGGFEVDNQIKPGRLLDG